MIAKSEKLIERRKRQRRPDSFFGALLERIQSHHEHFRSISPDYYFEQFELGRNYQHQLERYKARQYTDYHSFLNCHRTGKILHKNSLTARSVMEKLTSYTIGRGYTFKVKARERYRDSSETKSEVKKAQDAIDLFLSDNCWCLVQEETLADRLLAGGEVIRYYDKVGPKMDWHFVESSELRPPSGKRWQGRGVPPPFGIQYRSRNGQPVASQPHTYWINDTPVNHRNIQLATFGVDSRDPRGSPMMLMGYPTAKEIDEIDYAASQSCIAYAEHTINYNFPEDTDEDEVSDIVKQSEELRENAIKRGKLNAGGGVSMNVGHTVEGLAAQWTSDGFTSLIDSKARMFAAITDVPEFMVYGVADTGSRNTLISAEAPLTRRVERLGIRVEQFDKEFLYQVISIAMGKWQDAAWLEDFKRRVDIIGEQAIADAQDKAQRDKEIREQVRDGLLDPFKACKMLNHDPLEVMEGRERWAKLEQQMLSNLRDQESTNTIYSAEELAKRIDTAAALITIGFTEEEALERAGVDEMRDKTALDEAIERRNAVLDATNPNANPEPDPGETGEGDNVPGQAAA